jgi:hypothetical protein
MIGRDFFWKRKPTSINLPRWSSSGCSACNSSSCSCMASPGSSTWYYPFKEEIVPQVPCQIHENPMNQRLRKKTRSNSHLCWWSHHFWWFKRPAHPPHLEVSRGLTRRLCCQNGRFTLEPKVQRCCCKRWLRETSWIFGPMPSCPNATSSGWDLF